MNLSPPKIFSFLMLDMSQKEKMLQWFRSELSKSKTKSIRYNLPFIHATTEKIHCKIFRLKRRVEYNVSVTYIHTRKNEAPVR